MAKATFDRDRVYQRIMTTNEPQSQTVSETVKPEVATLSTLVRKTVYLTPELSKALKLKAAESDADMSAVVREALEKHLNVKTF
ncbi:hypothetical protein FACS1894208_09080 [Clostridia bacterium]|nr:hypothetical protein FACS1894208_09080 [Clostridia bacterium]